MRGIYFSKEVFLRLYHCVSKNITISRKPKDAIRKLETTKTVLKIISLTETVLKRFIYITDSCDTEEIEGRRKFEFFHSSGNYKFSICLVHIHYKLIYSYLCSAEQNNKTSLNNNHEWFIFMAEVDLCQSGKRFFGGIR